MRAVFFDVDGVLIHGFHAREELRRNWDENLMRDLGIDRARLKAAFFSTPLFRDVIIGRRALEDALAEVLPALDYHDDPRKLMEYWFENDSCLNGVLLEKIKILKDSGTVRLFIATNQEHGRARYLMDTLGLGAYFEDIFYSARLGVRKPEPEYFQKITDALGLDKAAPPPILFDDTPAVVAGARAYGWDAVEFLDIKDLCRNDFVRDILEA